MGRRLIYVFLLIDLLFGAALSGYMIGKYTNEKDSLFCSYFGRSLRLFCGSDDKERSQFRSERVLCHPRVGAEGSEI